MGTRGPKRTPTKVLEMRGSWLAKTRQGEPVPAAQTLTCPGWLGAEGKKVWRTLVKHLQAMGVVGTVDSFAVGRYCALWVRWRQAEDAIAASGATIPLCNAEGDVIGHGLSPYVKIADSLADKLLRLEQQYGMTASARASLSVHPADKASKSTPGADKTRFFKQRA